MYVLLSEGKSKLYELEFNLNKLLLYVLLLSCVQWTASNGSFSLVA